MRIRRDAKSDIEFKDWVGAKIREVRKLRSFSQEDLGNLIGCSFQQIQKYESGKNTISAKMLYEISTVCEVPASFFFGKSVEDAEFVTKLKSTKEIEPDAKELAEHFQKIKNPQIKKALLKLVSVQAQNN